MPDTRSSAMTLLVTAITALGPLTMSMYAPSMPTIAQALDTTAGMVQVTLSIYLTGFAVGQLVYGPLSDRFGRRRVLLLGLVVFIAGSVGCGLADDIETLIAARLVQALGAAAGPALGRAMVRDIYTREQAARVLSFIGMALAVAPAIGPVLGGYLQVWFDWHAIFAVLGAFGLVLLVVVAFRMPETNPVPDYQALRPSRMASNYADLMRHGGYVGYMAVGAVTLGGLFTFYAVAPFIFIDLIGLSPEQYGWTTSITVVGYLIGGVAANRLVGRLGIDRMIMISTAMVVGGAGLMLAFSLVHIITIASVIGPMALWTMGMGIALPNSMAGAMSPFPRIAGAASALMGFMQMAVGTVGSIAVARLSDGTALAPALALLAFALVGYGLYWRLVWCRRGSSGTRPGAAP
ncbi:multidrug effflux MFS transporter [Skermanella pratensis]|uniref:multidrug effflux MFS transporter n=1 Tax=Skermanella pratensis TaxID=2233999 RepID=UPI00130118AE|nr:multidrug effflux MFS transporter [Skermanella pratensis]